MIERDDPFDLFDSDRPSSREEDAFEEVHSELLLDEEGIPILSDIVDPDEQEDEDGAADEEDIEQATAAPATSRLSLNLPNHDSLLAAIRGQLHARLMRELPNVLSQVSGELAREVAAEFEQKFSDRLNQRLAERIESLIDDALEREIRPRASHPTQK